MTPFYWAVLTALTWGVVPIMEKIGLMKIEPQVGLFYRCLGVLVGVTLLFFYDSKNIRESFSQLHPGMLCLLAGGFLASVVGQIFFYRALKAGESSMVVPIAAAYPLFTFILGVLILGEKFTFAKAAGLVCILAGVVLLK